MIWFMLLSGCSPRTYNGEFAELDVELEQDQLSFDLQIIIDIRPEALPDPRWVKRDLLYVWTDLPSRGTTVEVLLDGRDRPRGYDPDNGMVMLRGLSSPCDPDQPCQRVIDLHVEREGTRAREVYVSADWWIDTTQATFTVFPSRATEQQIRMDLFEP